MSILAKSGRSPSTATGHNLLMTVKGRDEGSPPGDGCPTARRSCYNSRVPVSRGEHEEHHGLGGVGVPGDLARDVHLDGSVLIVAEAAGVDAGVRSLADSERWRVVDAVDASTASWLASIQKTSLIVVVSDTRDTTLAVIKAVRRVTSAPLLAIGTLSQEVRADALVAGADLVLERRLDEEELRAQVHALLRRSGETWEPAVRFLSAGDLLVDIWARACTVGAQPVALSPTEFRLLEYLMRHAHQALPAGKIVQRVWGTGYAPDLNALRIHVSRLRRKLGDVEHDAPVIRSVRGVGYEFTASVLEMGDGSTSEVGDHHNLALAERLLEIGRSLPTDSVADAAGYVTSTVVDAGVCDSAAIFEVVHQKLVLVAERGSSERWKATIARGVPLRSNFAQAHAVTTKRPTQVADIQLRALPYTETARILAEDGFHSCLFVPILTGEHTWGGLGLASRSRRPFDPVATTFCLSVAAMFGIVVRATR
jgi:DNA-binding response OmpR family regulator